MKKILASIIFSISFLFVSPQLIHAASSEGNSSVSSEKSAELSVTARLN
jgi:hypothetical protein